MIQFQKGVWKEAGETWQLRILEMTFSEMTGEGLAIFLVSIMDYGPFANKQGKSY